MPHIERLSCPPGAATGHIFFYRDRPVESHVHRGLELMANVITGASGQLGSHIAEQLTTRGEPVRAVVRPGADTTYLQQIGAQVVPCDYTDTTALRKEVD